MIEMWIGNWFLQYDDLFLVVACIDKVPKLIDRCRLDSLASLFYLYPILLYASSFH